jgi:hypothetical protein
VKRLLSAVGLGLAGFLAACGGGSTINPPPPSGNFSNASLTGQYAFLMSGVDPNGAYLARVGSFTADGNGHITAGLEDVTDLGATGSANLVSFTGGTYQIQPNGRGLIVLQAATGGGLQLNLAMQSSSAGFLVQTDLNATSSGSFDIQTSTDFSTSALLNHFVFDFSGVSFNSSGVAPISLVGEINFGGNGNITQGVMDTNDGNAAAPSGATTVTPGTYALDSNANGTSFGRGTMTFNGRSYAFYIVDSTRIKVLEEDSLGGSSGEALQQASTVPMQNSGFSGSFVYLVGGAQTTGNQGPVALAARFTADGNGGLNAIALDYNNDGNYTHVSPGSGTSSASYLIDSANPGSGRGTFTFTASPGTFSNVFYMISATQADVQQTSLNIIGDGPFYAQASGPFTVAGTAGPYAFNWSGVQLGSSTAVPFEEDFAGQYTLANATTNNIAGVIDFVELGLSSNNLFTNVGLGGTLTVNGDGTANNLYKFTLGGSSSSTINFQAYFVNANTVLLMCSDSARTTAGTAVHQ